MDRTLRDGLRGGAVSRGAWMHLRDIGHGRELPTGQSGVSSFPEGRPSVPGLTLPTSKLSECPRVASARVLSFGRPQGQELRAAGQGRENRNPTESIETRAWFLKARRVDAVDGWRGWTEWMEVRE